MYNFVQTSKICPFMSRDWKMMCIPALSVTEIKSLYFWHCFHVVLSRRAQSIHSKGKRKKPHSARSVKSFLLNQNLVHSIKSFHLYTFTYYTHLVCLHACVRPCKCARALPVNSLHSNPCQGTQSLEYIKSAVLGQAPGIDLSIYHAFLNPRKENELSFQTSWIPLRSWCSRRDDFFFFFSLKG